MSKYEHDDDSRTSMSMQVAVQVLPPALLMCAGTWPSLSPGKAQQQLMARVSEPTITCKSMSGGVRASRGEIGR